MPSSDDGEQVLVLGAVVAGVVGLLNPALLFQLCAAIG